MPPIPPPLHTSEAGTFTQETLRVRIPGILDRTVAKLGAIPPEVAARLTALGTELRSGQVRALNELAPDRAAWDEAVAPHLGHSWLDIPWYFAESYFYRRVLEASGYFQPGPMHTRDPFAAEKAEEWAPAPQRCADLLAGKPDLRGFLLASLWGNRADLSLKVLDELGHHVGEDHDVIVDDSAPVSEHLGRCREIAVIADNSGTELAMDLALIDHLLTHGVSTVDLHIKNHPLFVSDAIAADLDHALAALDQGTTASLAQRLRHYRAIGQLRVKTHPFYTSSLHYPQLPGDLRADLKKDLVILKGDANYRRLCSDAHWPHDTPFAEVVETFPAPLVALRTLKAEVMVGLRPGRAETEAAADPQWLVNGTRGVIQARL